MGIGRIAFAGLLLLAVAACARDQVVVREPVYVTRVVYVRIDPALTAPCPVADKRNDSGKELLRIARARKAVLVDCDSRMGKIRAIEGTPVP